MPRYRVYVEQVIESVYLVEADSEEEAEQNISTVKPHDKFISSQDVTHVEEY